MATERDLPPPWRIDAFGPNSTLPPPNILRLHLKCKRAFLKSAEKIEKEARDLLAELERIKERKEGNKKRLPLSDSPTVPSTDTENPGSENLLSTEKEQTSLTSKTKEDPSSQGESSSTNKSLQTRRRREKLFLEKAPGEEAHWKELNQILQTTRKECSILHNACHEFDQWVVNVTCDGRRPPDLRTHHTVVFTKLDSLEGLLNDVNVVVQEPFEQFLYQPPQTGKAKPPGRPQLPCEDDKKNKARERLQKYRKECDFRKAAKISMCIQRNDQERHFFQEHNALVEGQLCRVFTRRARARLIQYDPAYQQLLEMCRNWQCLQEVARLLTTHVSESIIKYDE